MSLHPVPDVFHQQLQSALVDCASVHFEDAAHYARANGLQAHTEFASGARLELRLIVKRPSDSVPCAYRIAGVPGSRTVVHEKSFGREVQRLEAPLESINQTLVETELAAFFIKATALPLSYVAARHSPGFL